MGLKIMSKKNTELITKRLLELYPDGSCALKYNDEFELLVASRLSAQCTDVRVNMVTPQLFERFKGPQDYIDADINAIETIIRSCGLYHTKARDIKNMSFMIMDTFGGKIPDNMDDLLRLPGVGRKIANLVLGEIFHVPGVIVADTHCIRLSNRLGYCSSSNQNIVERQLRSVIAPQDSLRFCHALVAHGRSVCKAQTPACAECALAELCPYLKEKVRSEKKEGKGQQGRVRH